MAVAKSAIIIDRSDVVNLVGNDKYQDDLGVWHDRKEKRQIYVSVKNAGQSEWYQANQSGLRAGYTFTCFAPDYNGEEIVEYKDKLYEIYRTYQLQDDLLELHTKVIKGLDYE